MSDEINEEQKTSEEPEVKSDELTEDVLDDVSAGAVDLKVNMVGGEPEDQQAVGTLSTEQDTTGRTADQLHKDHIDIESWSWGGS